MGLPKIITHMTPQEYYLHERTAVEKSEYFQGKIYSRAGGSTRHSIIKVNLIGELRRLLKGKHCSTYDSDQRIRALWNGLRCYPDASVICGPVEYDPEDTQKETATNPTVVFEVLSPANESYDRGRKAEAYRGIDSLRAYVLILQERPHVEIQE
ncbi:MAG: Uma2 family endonuclease [Prosthecobacter sp.]|uniref:Uma2 family endonuclease n=1 Tax=Prosthecobacter sp. TaxID=1965333 RepID=UPI00390101E5